jgi:hypothetical protein
MQGDGYNDGDTDRYHTRQDIDELRKLKRQESQYNSGFN